jgi:hypothetical protein
MGANYEPGARRSGTISATDGHAEVKLIYDRIAPDPSHFP